MTRFQCMVEKDEFSQVIHVHLESTLIPWMKRIRSETYTVYAQIVEQKSILHFGTLFTPIHYSYFLQLSYYNTIFIGGRSMYSINL